MKTAADAGRFYEQAIPADVRLRAGQFYTPAPLCDVMLSLALRPEDRRLLDPGCGAGAFLLRAIDRQTAPGNAPLLTELIGIDRDSVAVALARRQFLENAGPGIPNPQVIVGDFISKAADGWPPFDVIVGNPPYVRQEHWGQEGGKAASLAYLRGKYSGYLARHPDQAGLFAPSTDLYLAFFLQAATLLKPGGRLVFVTSNSWLNASFGQVFHRFLSHHFHVLALAESACERWFPDAAIIPLVVVLARKTGEDDPAPPPSVRHIRFHQPLPDCLPDPGRRDYWEALDCRTSAWLRGEAAAVDASGPEKVTVETLPSSLFAGDVASPGLGFRLRCPRPLDELLDEAPARWARLDDLGAVRYPLKTGINRFFYLDGQRAADWGIEPEFLFPVIRSARNVQTYQVIAESVGEFLFSCPLTAEELERAGKPGAAAYIRWGETQTAPPRQKRAQPIPWPQVASVRHHRPWSYIKPLPPAHILCNRFFDRRFFFALCRGGVMEDQTFYGLTLADPVRHPPDLIAGLLNSTLTYALVEFSGRASLGEGVLQFSRGDMAALPLPSPDEYDAGERAAIQACFEAMASRRILPIEQEAAQADRLALDRAVLAPLLRRTSFDGDAAGFRAVLIEALLNRVAERRRMARR